MISTATDSCLGIADPTARGRAFPTGLNKVLPFSEEKNQSVDSGRNKLNLRTRLVMSFAYPKLSNFLKSLRNKDLCNVKTQSASRAAKDKCERSKIDLADRNNNQQHPTQPPEANDAPCPEISCFLP